MISPVSILLFSAEHLKSVDEASLVEFEFPYSLYSTEMVRESVYLGAAARVAVNQSNPPPVKPE
jgi:hypothetical protein